MRRSTSVYTDGDYDIHCVNHRYILTVGGNSVDDPFDTYDEAFEAFKDYEGLTECDHCGNLWNEDDVPVCPVCNAAVLSSIDKISALWHSSNPKAGDVLDISFGDDGRPIVKTYNLYESRES